MNPRSESKTTKLRLLCATRDHWLCYRCGQPIDPQLRYPNPMSVSLEHLANIAEGGNPYDPANCTVSHLTHNQSAGATFGNRRRQRLVTSENW